MGGWGLFGSKKKKEPTGNGRKVDSTGYTDEQKKAQATGSKKGSKALSAVEKRRKAMAEVMGK